MESRKIVWALVPGLWWATYTSVPPCMQVETVLTGDPEGRADYRLRFECDGGRHCRLDTESAFRAISPIPFALALFDQEGLIRLLRCGGPLARATALSYTAVGYELQFP